MKILIFGSNGMCGSYLCKYLKNKKINVIGATSIDYDLNYVTKDSLFNFILKKELDNNSIIINSAGIIPHSQIKYNANDQMFMRVNTLFPIILSQICKELGIKMIQITTDCVFDGKKGDYNENDIHNANDIYGITKSLSDIADCTIIRTSFIGEELYNKKSLIEWVKLNNNQIVKGFSNHLWNGITCLQLSKIIYKIIKLNLFWKGVRHIFSPNKISKYDLINMIGEIYKINITVEKFATDKNIDKSLISLYETNNNFKIPELYDQLLKMSKFKLYI